MVCGRLQRTGGILILYNEEDFLQLSGIQHFEFCRRQWALAYMEMQWQENVRTVEGRILHENAHDAGLKEKRGDLIVVRAMPIHSREMGVSGECDVIEFHRAEDGINLLGKEGFYKVVPVEYKRGKTKTDDSDILQVAAQALCLEEMLCCEIPYGYIYYGEVRRRIKIEFTEAIREKVRNIFAEMHKYYEQRYTPKAKTSKKCNACSLKDICVPVLNKKKSVSGYIDKIISEEENT
jgi:CRISPR-associated exonuclease Cas4